MSHTTDSISQYGITWEFDEAYTFGQYANGDYWVKGPVTITRVTPESTTTTEGRVMHGTMLNPYGGTQGYDSHPSDLSYDADRNVDPGATGEDLVVDEGSVVSAISKSTPDDDGRPLLSDLAVLTVVSDKPPDDAFRPDPYRASKAHDWRESDLDDSILRDLPAVGSTPDVQAAAAEALRFWNEHNTSWQQRAVHAENNQPVYGRDIAKRNGQMLLLLHLDIDPDSQRDLFVGLVQYGLDIYGRLQTGGRWQPNGGHNAGRKMPMLLAGLALDDSAILDAADQETDPIRFQDDGQTFFVSGDDVGKQVSNGHETYRQEDVGMPEWGIRHWSDDSRDDRSWGASYRWIGSAYVAHALAAHLTPGAVEAWNHPAYFAYVDRYEQRGSPDPTQPNGIGAFAQACWDEYRHLSRNGVGDTGHRLQFSTPAVGANNVYTAGLGQRVRAIPREGGTPVWTFTRAGALSDSSPVLDEQRGQLYVGSGGGKLYAIDTGDGTQAWAVGTDSAITSTPRLDDGTLYVGTNDGTLLAVDAGTGTVTAQATLGGGIYGQPAVDTDRVYALEEDGTLHARTRTDLGGAWQRETGGNGVHSSPTVESGSVYVATDAVYAFAVSDGSLDWQQAYAGTAGSSPLVHKDVLYVGDAAGTVHALDVTASGATLWTANSWRAVATDPVFHSGSILVGSVDGTLHSFDVASQSRDGTAPIGNTLRSAPVVADGDIYVGVEDGDGGRTVRLPPESLAIQTDPSISRVTQTGDDDHGDPVYEVQGNGFAEKDQGPPVLYDYVNQTYENGNLHTFNGSFYDNEQDLHTAYSELDRVYDGMSIPQEEQDRYGVSRQDKPPAQYISDETEQSHRHEGVDAHYRFRNGSFTGLPMAYGGNHESTDPDMDRRYERPEDSDQIYLAWWLRPAFGLHSHTTFQPASFEGQIDFGDSKRDRGERFVIPNGGAGGIDVDGWVIGIRDGSGSSSNDDGRVEIEFDTLSNVDRIAGETLIGQDTGAKIHIPADEDRANIERFVSPNKLLRIWGSGGRTISMAWGVSVVKLENSVWYDAKPEPQEWNLLETVIDVEEGFLEAWVNFEKRAAFTFDPEDVETTNSPTMQLLGMHTGNFGFNTFRVSEIYQDSSIQRVVVADARRLADASHYELQRPTEWSAQRVRFALNDGQLPTDQQLYVFVFDDQGQVNEQGYPISV